MTPKRQKQVLAGLVLVLLVFAVRAYLQVRSSSGPKRPRATASRPAPRSGAQAPVPSGDQIVDLALQQLERKPAVFEPGRDPFRFQRKEAPKPPPPPPPPRAATPAKPRPPEPTFQFLGSFGPEEKRVAVFSDQSEIFNVLEGDVFKEAFVVKKIGYESADIGWVDFPDEPARRLAAGG